jgi:hypothetical protein
VFAFLAGKGTPRHAGFALPRVLDPAEALAVQAALMEVPGVVVARIDPERARAWIGYRSGATHENALADVLAGLGLPPRVLPEEEAAAAARGHDTCC